MARDRAVGLTDAGGQVDEERFRAAERRLWEAVGARPDERRLELERLGIAVRVQELGTGPPVLFVHGANNGGSSWASLAAALAGMRCILLDRPGCGLSDPVAERFVDVEALGAFAETLIVDVLDALGVDRAHLVATSFGGYHALRSAAAHPSRIDRIVLFGWSAGASRIPASLRLSTVPAVGRLMAAVPQNERTVRALLRRIGLRAALDQGKFSPAMFDWYVSLLRDTDTFTNELGAGPRFPVARMDDRLLLPAAVLADVRAPTLCWWGEDDPFGRPDVARAFVELLPDARLELVRAAGHAPWIDEPDRAADAARTFLGA